MPKDRRGPCPFCGSTQLKGPRRGEPYVVCENCWATGPDQNRFYGPFVQYCIVEASAVDDWNARGQLHHLNQRYPPHAESERRTRRDRVRSEGDFRFVHWGSVYAPAGSAHSQLHRKDDPDG